MRAPADCPACGSKRVRVLWGKKSRWWCKVCASIRHKTGVESSLETKAKMIWRRTKSRARQRGTVFDISVVWVHEQLLEGVCQVTGIPFDFRLMGDKSNPFAPSIDRIDSSKGYTSSNVQMVCWIYNRAKSSDTHHDVLMLAKALTQPKEQDDG